MLDYNIFKWSWTQRFLLMSYTITYWLIMWHPYAFIETETISKTYSASANLFLHVSMLVLFIGILPCYGFIKIDPTRFLVGSLGCYGANLLFILVGYFKDKRLPTWFVLFGAIGVLITIGLSALDRKMYRYEER